MAARRKPPAAKAETASSAASPVQGAGAVEGAAPTNTKGAEAAAQADASAGARRAAGGSKSTAPAGQANRDRTITVIGPKKGRWRAGRQFTAAASVIPIADLSKGEIAALKADPALNVVISD